MKRNLLFILVLTSFFVSCRPKVDFDTKADVVLLDSSGWCWENELTEELNSAVATAETSEPIKLFFYGWGEDEDYSFQIEMPKVKKKCEKVIMEYTMCGWNKGPADWDMTTEIRIKDKSTGEWVELQRAFTPYGGSFSSDWKKVFYMDVSHLLPILQQDGPAEFKIFYCGWDATETKAHAVNLKFYFLNGYNRFGGKVLSCQKVYDSFTSGNNGYRAWAYGVADNSIEDASRLGERTIVLPKQTKRAVLRVCFTGHGQESSTVDNYHGYFPGRSKKPVNPAEFDENWYTLRINGKVASQRGHIWEINKSGVRGNYKQAGTWAYARAGWGPGKPGNAQYWVINDIPKDGRITIDLDLDEYVSDREKPNDAYVANYYVMADIFAIGK